MAEEQDIKSLESNIKSYKANVATVFKGSLIWDSDLIFKGRTQKGEEIDYDANVEWGCQPSEPVMMSLGACVATDCVIFLQKMRVVLNSFKVDITGYKERTEPPQYFSGFKIILNIEGENINENKMKKAVTLSIEKYCGIYHSLRSDIKLEIEYNVNNEINNTLTFEGREG